MQNLQEAFDSVRVETLLGEYSQAFSDALTRWDLRVVSTSFVSEEHLPRTASRSDGGGPVAAYDLRRYLGDNGAKYALVFELRATGIVREYLFFPGIGIPTSSPRGMTVAVGYLVESSTNKVIWQNAEFVQRHVDGEWAEPPSYPRVTAAAQQSLRDAVERIFFFFMRDVARGRHDHPIYTADQSRDPVSTIAGADMIPAGGETQRENSPLNGPESFPIEVSAGQTPPRAVGTWAAPADALGRELWNRAEVSSLQDDTLPTVSASNTTLTSRSEEPRVPRSDRSERDVAGVEDRYWVQAGAFKSPGHAAVLSSVLLANGFPASVARVTRIARDGRDVKWHLVRVGAFPDRLSAAATRHELLVTGYYGFLTVGNAK